jgi:hypothetical protein
MQQTGDSLSAKDCWQKAAQGHRAQKSAWHAANALEKAADLAKEAQEFYEMESLYSECAQMYIEEGRPESAAEAMSRGAVALGGSNPAAAASMHFKAIEWIEESGKDSMFPDIYRQAILHAVRSKSWDAAVRIELRFALSSYNAKSMSTMSKSYLSAIIICLYAEDGKQAWQTYQDALDVPEFASSDQAFAAEDLMSAYRRGTTEAIESAIAKNTCLTFLDNCIARLVKNLAKTDIARTAKGVGGHIVQSTEEGSQLEEDLT